MSDKRPLRQLLIYAHIQLMIPYQLGRILSHGYVITTYFPLSLAQAFATALISTEAVSDVLFQSFYNFIDDFEAQAIQRCLAGDEDSTSVLESIVVPMLSPFDLHTCPTTLGNLKEVTLQVARYVLLHKPYYALLEMKRGMEAAHPQVWLRCSSQLIPKLFSVLMPTPGRV